MGVGGSIGGGVGEGIDSVADAISVDSSGNVTIDNIFSLGNPAPLTIASGEVTITKSSHTIDTEGAGPTDDLETIEGGINGAILSISPTSGARTVVVKDGVGNINCEGDFSMDSDADAMLLWFFAGAWREVARSNNA